MRSWRALSRFLSAEDGQLSVATIILMPLLLFAAAAAIDMTSIESEKRYVQSQADVAALSSVRNFTSASSARTAARQTIEHNRYYDTLDTPDSQIEFGNVVDGDFVPASDQNSVLGSNAVRVTVKSHALSHLLATT